MPHPSPPHRHRHVTVIVASGPRLPVLVSLLSPSSWWWSWWWSLLFGVASVFASPSPLLGWRRCASHLAFAAQARSDLRCQWWGSGGVGWRLDRLIGEVLMLSLMLSLVKGTQPSQLSHSSLKPLSCTRYRQPPGPCQCSGPNPDDGGNSGDGNHDTTTRRRRLPQRLGDSRQQGGNKNQGGGVNGNGNDNSKTDDDNDQDSDDNDQDGDDNDQDGDGDGYDHDYDYVTQRQRAIILIVISLV
ncbi:hypothetical protein EDB89DRAFT_1914246 [Lactarius sanguifluus]|nr:hypothetical protein EDB89DRAFT_1914246 [Lactarius sanguifluus]